MAGKVGASDVLRFGNVKFYVPARLKAPCMFFASVKFGNATLRARAVQASPLHHLFMAMWPLLNEKKEFDRSSNATRFLELCKARSVCVAPLGICGGHLVVAGKKSKIVKVTPHGAPAMAMWQVVLTFQPHMLEAKTHQMT